jgi:hypothetical protein
MHKIKHDGYRMIVSPMCRNGILRARQTTLFAAGETRRSSEYCPATLDQMNGLKRGDIKPA